MAKVLKDLKLKSVGSEEKSNNDKLYSRGSYITEKEVKKIEKKKSRRRFFTGFAVVSMVFIIFATLVVGSFVAWDMYGKEPTGLTLPQAAKTLVDLYKDGSGVVTNPYDAENDLNSFYTDLKKGLYLAQDCEISINDIVSGLLAQATGKQDGEEGAEDSENSGNEEVLLSNGKPVIIADENAPEIGDNGSITGNAALDDLLESLEFDFSVLEGKDQETLEKEMLELTDKELAAVLNEAFSSISEIDALKKIETDYGVDIESALSIEQVIIDSATVLEQQDARVLVTIRINLRDAAKTALSNNKAQLLSKLFGEKEVPGIVNTVADALPSLLPKTLYITASVFPNQQTWSAQVLVNNMDETQQAAVNRILDRFLATTDEDGNNISFMQSINQKVYDTIAKINELVPINFTPSGSFETKPIQAVINMLGASNLTQGDFLALIRDVKLPTAESLGVDGFTESAQTLAANNFINGEFSTKYYFNNVVNEETDEYFITASNLFTKLNTFSEDEETLQRIQIRDSIVVGEYEDGGEFRPFADNDTLAALLNGYLKNQAYKVENMEPWIMDVVCTATGSDNVKGDYFTLQITIELDLTGNIDAQLGDNESMKRLVKQLLPDSIYVFLTYTQYSGSTETPSVALVDINKKGNEMSKQHFETLMSLLNAVQNKNSSGDEGGAVEEEGGTVEGEDTEDQISSMTFEELEAQLNEKIYQAFLDIENNLGTKIEFVSSSGNAQGGAILPNIFEILANNEKLKYDEEQDYPLTEEEFNEKYAISGAEMYDILCMTYKYDPTGTYVETNITDDVINDGISSFVKEIDSKYYITTTNEGDDWSAANIQNMLKKVSDEYTTRLRVTGENGLLQDNTEYNQLNPYLSQYEFANIVNESGRLNNLMQILPESEVKYILIYIDDNGVPYIRLRINGKISFDNVTGEGADAINQNKKYSTLFPYDVDVIVDIKVETDDNGNITDYVPTVNINSIENDELDKMLFFVKRYSGQTSMGEGEDKQDFTKEGLELTIKSKLVAAFNDMKAGGKVELEFVEKNSGIEGGIQLSTVFELAVNNIYTEVGEEKPSGEEMRSTIKKLHSGLDGYDYSNKAFDASGIKDDNSDDSAFYIEGSMTSGNSASVNVTAQFMDAYMVSKVKGENFNGIIGGNPEDINFYQSYILPKYTNGSDEEIERNTQVRDYFGLNTTEDWNNSYMLVTLSVETKNLSSEMESNNLIPSTIYLTAQILLESGNSKDSTRIFVNTMNDRECEIMDRILKSADYNNSLFGGSSDESGSAEEEDIVDRIFAIKLVDYTYTFASVYPIKVEVTVEDVITNSFVWYCSLYDTESSVEDDRRSYIKAEAAKNFSDGSSPRYGVAYLRFERNEILNLSDI